MIGERIRRLRTQLGLSQSQLAGKDMTRAFVSQVENGKCTPSPQTLATLAKRLGKPVAYFLEEDPSDTFGVKLLFDAARKDMAMRERATALPKIEEALRMVRRAEDPDLEADIRMLYGECLAAVGRREDALDQYEEVADRCKALGKTVDLVRVWLEMGNCYLQLEQFPTARRYYQKVIRYSVNIKSAQEYHVLALCYLGSAHLGMGEPEEAVRSYREALQSVDGASNPALWGHIAAGLAGAYRRAGKPELARDFSRQALTRLEAAKSPDALGAQQNLALALMDLGNWEEAYALLHRTLSSYKLMDRPAAQANVMDDLVRYHLHKGDVDRAEALCWQALDLLTGTAKLRLSGLLYRRLGQIYVRRQNPARAHELFKLACALFRQVRATTELMQTLDEIAALSPELHAEGQGD